MSKPDQISLETRASSTFVQGKLDELLTAHKECFAHFQCELLCELEEVLEEWKQAEAELNAKHRDEAARDALLERGRAFEKAQVDEESK